MAPLLALLASARRASPVAALAVTAAVVAARAAAVDIARAAAELGRHTAQREAPRGGAGATSGWAGGRHRARRGAAKQFLPVAASDCWEPADRRGHGTSNGRQREAEPAFKGGQRAVMDDRSWRPTSSVRMPERSRRELILGDRHQWHEKHPHHAEPGWRGFQRGAGRLMSGRNQDTMATDYENASQARSWHPG